MRRSWLTDHFFNETRNEREKAFLENGSKLLEKRIASCNGKPIPIRTFSAQQLRQATNNYCEHLGKYWYKGSLEGKIVLVNRFSGSGAHLTINDIVISAQMSAHSNVLKPIGCCLETTPLILVYEFAANGFLADQIYVKRVTELQYQPMVWERRLKIARQISHAISYLHTAFPRPVIHMFMHMRDILLDEHDVPKLSNFIYSKSIPESETDVKGFWGIQNVRFCPPESKASGKVTEKTDVYNFGRLLLELLTGEDSYNITRVTIDRTSNLIAHMHDRAQGSCINEIVDPAIMAIGEGGASLPRQLQAVLDLALTCTEKDPQRRPTMVDVTKELRQIERFTQADEELLGSLRNSKLHERFEEHASTSLKRNLSNDESHAVKEASVLIVAGTDTSAMTLEWAMSNMINHPDVLKKARVELDNQIEQEKLIDEPDVSKLHYIQSIILETLRLQPVAPLLVPHLLSNDCTIGGYDIPCDTMLLVNAWAIHRDPKLWDDDTSFKPKRFGTTESDLYKLMPFGLGRRACPRAGLVQRILGLTLGSMIQCFEWERVTMEEVDMAEGNGVTMPKVIPLDAMCKARPIVHEFLSKW